RSPASEYSLHRPDDKNLGQGTAAAAALRVPIALQRQYLVGPCAPRRPAGLLVSSHAAVKKPRTRDSGRSRAAGTNHGSAPAPCRPVRITAASCATRVV